MAFGTYASFGLYIFIIWVYMNGRGKIVNDMVTESNCTDCNTDDEDEKTVEWLSWHLVFLIFTMFIPAIIFFWWQCSDTVRSRNYLRFIPIIWIICAITNVIKADIWARELPHAIFSIGFSFYMCLILHWFKR